jgi:curved DNA-binding protein CbpA
MDTKRIALKVAARHQRYRILYARILRAMSMEDAKTTLGFPPDATPNSQEVNKAWREKAFKNHPDRGGDPEKMVEINVAKDILDGKERPTAPSYDYGEGSTRGPSPEPPSEPYKPPEDIEVISFEEARSKAGIPGGVEWFFVTEPHYSGYSSDEMRNQASGWVAVGQTDKNWVFVAAEHYGRDYYIGGRGKIDSWYMKSMTLPKEAQVTARMLYGGVMKAWKLFEHVEKRFNSKIIPAEGWTFKEKLPTGRSLSIKNFLLNMGMMSEGDLKTPRKYTVQVHYEGVPFDKRENPPSDFYKPQWADPYKLNLIINGKEHTLSVKDVERLEKLRVKGKNFVDWVFGEYSYGGETKSLSRKREGKEVMGWMAEKLPNLPGWVSEALTAASQAQPSKSRRRR